VFVDTSLEECENRDVKGLYKKARAGEIPDFTGIHSPFEAPLQPDVKLRTEEASIEQCVELVLMRLLGCLLNGHESIKS